MRSFRIAKIGKNAFTATDPNDFIFNPEYNTFKVLNEAVDYPTLGTAGSETFRNVAHGMGYTPFTIGFCKFANSRVAHPGTLASNANFTFTNLRVNSTNVRFGYINNTGGNYSPQFKYIQTELPLAGTPNITQVGGRRIVIAKEGYNAFTETNPNNLVYDSRWKTLKYFIQGKVEIDVPSSTPAANVPNVYEETFVTHGLGYYPFFSASGVFATDTTRTYVIPITFSDAGFWGYDFVYATTNGLVFRSERGNPFGGISMGGYTITIYYKIYSYDLGFS